MGQPFSQRVADPTWRAEAESWIAARLDDSGWHLTGTIEQPRIRPWSTQLVVPTSGGALWFKANCRPMAFEPALHATLARLAPDEVDTPVAVDADRGWILTADRGTTLGDSHEPQLGDWQAVVRNAARLQQGLLGHRDDLLASGLPDCSPATVPTRFDRLLRLLTESSDDHPSLLGDDVAEQLQARRPFVAEAAELLEASSVPSTLQHGDLHPWNVFAVDGGLRIFDFGDAQWAHALEVLSVPFGWVTSRSSLSWPAVERVYADEWGLDPDTFAALVRAAGLTQPVNRAFTWWTALQSATAAEWQEWGDAPAHHISNVLGTWP